MREIEDMEGFRFSGKVVNNIRYADDTVILPESEQQLHQLINTVVTESELKGLYLHSTKSFTMVLSKAKVNPACSVSVHGNVLGQVQSFVYLGSLFTSDARSDKEIRRRIGIAKSTFTSMNIILTARNINIAVRLRVPKCYKWSTLLYGCEISQLCGGTVRKRSVKTPNADYCYFHMDILYVDIYKFVTCSMNIL